MTLSRFPILWSVIALFIISRHPHIITDSVTEVARLFQSNAQIVKRTKAELNVPVGMFHMSVGLHLMCPSRKEPTNNVRKWELPSKKVEPFDASILATAVLFFLRFFF